MYKVDRHDMIIDNLVGDLSEEKIEVNVVFFIELFVDWLCLKKSTIHCMPRRFHLFLLFE